MGGLCGRSLTAGKIVLLEGKMIPLFSIMTLRSRRPSKCSMTWLNSLLHQLTLHTNCFILLAGTELKETLHQTILLHFQLSHKCLSKQTRHECLAKQTRHECLAKQTNVTSEPIRCDRLFLQEIIACFLDNFQNFLVCVDTTWKTSMPPLRTESPTSVQIVSRKNRPSQTAKPAGIPSSATCIIRYHSCNSSCRMDHKLSIKQHFQKKKQRVQFLSAPLKHLLPQERIDTAGPRIIEMPWASLSAFTKAWKGAPSSHPQHTVLWQPLDLVQPSPLHLIFFIIMHRYHTGMYGDCQQTPNFELRVEIFCVDMFVRT